MDAFRRGPAALDPRNPPEPTDPTSEASPAEPQGEPRGARAPQAIDEAARAEAASLADEGTLLLLRGEAAEAEDCFRKALRLDPRAARAHLGLGRLVEARGKPAVAILHYQTASALDPGSAEAFVRLGDAYIARGKDGPALAAYDRALRADPKNAAAHYHQALVFLLQGSYGRGWRGFEWRWRVPADQGGAASEDAIDRARLSEAGLAAWDGKAREGLRLLVHDEGTPVEDVFYAHCLGDLLASGAKVFFRGAPAFSILLQRSFPDIELAAPDDPLPALDAAAAIGSLPAIYRRQKTQFKRPPGYLVADLRATTSWRERYRARRAAFKIGFSWRGEGAWPAAGALALPLGELAPLFAVPGTHGVSLETGPEAEAEALALELDCWPELEADVDQLAARIDATDLVVAVPGLVAALAGALGKPVFVLAPPVAGWPWLLHGRQLPWFPAMTVVRRRAGQPWAKAVAALAAELYTGIGAAGALASEP